MKLPPILSSRKFQGAVAGAVMLLWPLLFTLTDSTATRPQKQAAAEDFTRKVCYLFGIAIGGTAIEDAAQKYNPLPSQSPSTAPQVNVNSDVTNSPPQPPPPDVPPQPAAVPVQPRPPAPATFTLGGTTTHGTATVIAPRPSLVPQHKKG